MPSFGAMASVDIFLVRHGLAGEPTPGQNDNLRPLTRAGRQRTREVAKRLDRLGVGFDLLLASPLVRAQQTAELLQDLGLCKRLETSALLSPGGDFRAWVKWLGHWRRAPGHRRLGLVGHMPDLGAWAEELLWGEARQRLVLKKAGVVGLTLPSRGNPVGRCSLFLLSPPRYLL